MLNELPGDQLADYVPDLAEPADLDLFWTTTLADARGQLQAAGLRAGRVRVDPG